MVCFNHQDHLSPDYEMQPTANRLAQIGAAVKAFCYTNTQRTPIITPETIDVGRAPVHPVSGRGPSFLGDPSTPTMYTTTHVWLTKDISKNYISFFVKCSYILFSSLVKSNQGLMLSPVRVGVGFPPQNFKVFWSKFLESL
ncbi:hypothetical protein CI610_02273 [invertebrate metagenome]|uniref:Uncharacterized protein n=1 Tax=invertebrate metagenome TaxID=1711999 RepID=A0A2H9T6D2_9ZZZZ